MPKQACSRKTPRPPPLPPAPPPTHPHPPPPHSPGHLDILHEPLKVQPLGFSLIVAVHVLWYPGIPPYVVMVRPGGAGDVNAAVREVATLELSKQPAASED